MKCLVNFLHMNQLSPLATLCNESENGIAVTRDVDVIVVFWLDRLGEATALAGEGDVDIQEVGVHDLPIFLQEVGENLLICLSEISSGQNNDIINLDSVSQFFSEDGFRKAILQLTSVP